MEWICRNWCFLARLTGLILMRPTKISKIDFPPIHALLALFNSNSGIVYRVYATECDGRPLSKPVSKTATSRHICSRNVQHTELVAWNWRAQPVRRHVCLCELCMFALTLYIAYKLLANIRHRCMPSAVCVCASDDEPSARALTHAHTQIKCNALEKWIIRIVMPIAAIYFVAFSLRFVFVVVVCPWSVFRR